MTRKQMITFAKNLIAEYQQEINENIDAGVFEPDEYSWQEMLADYTNIKVKSAKELETLSDDKLKQIIEAYK